MSNNQILDAFCTSGSSPTLTASEIETYIKERVPGAKLEGPEWRGPCPVHDGKGLNFTINATTGQAYCHSTCGQGWNLFSLEACPDGRNKLTLANNLYVAAPLVPQEIKSNPIMQP